MDFVSSLSEFDKKILVESLGDDYSSDDLANILKPFGSVHSYFWLTKIAIGILGETKSQLALNTLLEALDFVDDDEIVSLIKHFKTKNFRIKIVGTILQEDSF